MIDTCSAKEEFIFRQSDIDERILFFDENYDAWISALPEEVLEIVLSMLAHFDYYSHQDANKMLRALHEKLIQRYNGKEPDALFTYIKKKDGKICSSIDYWSEYRIINKVDKNLCTDDIVTFPSNSWALVDSIVIIDDCCGTGGSLEKFIRLSGRDFSGKTIYYLVLHFLEQSKSMISHIENTYGVTINVLAINSRIKASEIISGTNAQETRQVVTAASKKMKINPDYFLGKDDSEGLMAFYNNTPNNTIGLFWCESEKNNPVLPRDFGVVPKWRPEVKQMKESKRSRKESNYMAVKRND